MTFGQPHRLRLIVEYDGSAFHGWQIQSDGRTVQGALEEVLGRITGEPRSVVGAGRTDAGVHALGQVASVDVPPEWSAARVRKAVNALLSPDVRIIEAARAPDDFHPRYDATARRYEYRLGLSDAAGSPFHHRWCWDASEMEIDTDLLDAATELIPGERSFARFAKVGQPERGTRCHVFSATWDTPDNLGRRFEIVADRYLHHMVRYLVGTMVEVARGRRPLSEMADMLADPESEFTTSPPAPAQGLYLAEVRYPDERVGDHPDRDPPFEPSSPSPSTP